jgi:serine/threonine-protein kinase
MFSPLSSSDFLTAVERSGVLSDVEMQEIRDRTSIAPTIDPSTIARELVQEGRLTEFQARRLLVGKSRGLVFGRYVLLDHLGTGAMGRVFKARHRLMDRVVALKVVLPVCVTSKHAVSRFFREMKIVGMLDHPNVVRAFDADQHDDSPYIVMEYLEGEDLEHVLQRRGMLPPQEVVEYMIQATWGLAHAHERGVVHRDIKPTNMFLTSNGVVKILDLGLGAFVGVSNETITPVDTDEGFVVGTTDYMSPEQVTGEPLDARTDLFSLGCTMYRLLTRNYAFPGMTKMDRLVRRIRDAHVPIREVRPDLPLPLARYVDRLLAHQPEERFATAAEAAESLEELVPSSSRPGRGARAGLAGRPPRATGSSTAESEHPLDWSLIESALHGKKERQPEIPLPSMAPATPPPARASRQLSSHRKSLEADGEESGREVHQQYRSELIQLKRSMTDQREEEAAEAPPTVSERWLEHVGEQLGDFLAEPNAGQVVVLLIVIAIAIAFSLAYALG